MYFIYLFFEIIIVVYNYLFEIYFIYFFQLLLKKKVLLYYEFIQCICFIFRVNYVFVFIKLFVINWLDVKLCFDFFILRCRLCEDKIVFIFIK